jgi:hypothetical protein
MTLHAVPKPEKPIRGTAECRRHMALVAQLDCIGCGRSDVVLHHPIMGRHSQTKTSDMDVLPVCPDCHDLIHNHRSVWLALHKPDHEYLPKVRAAVERLRALTV